MGRMAGRWVQDERSEFLYVPRPRPIHLEILLTPTLVGTSRGWRCAAHIRPVGRSIDRSVVGQVEPAFDDLHDWALSVCEELYDWMAPWTKLGSWDYL